MPLRLGRLFPSTFLVPDAGVGQGPTTPTRAGMLTDGGAACHQLSPSPSSSAPPTGRWLSYLIGR